MTQLLISVKNVAEALIVKSADVDIIDLKDPSIGALGALSVDEISRIVHEVEGAALISATVGEGHDSVGALVSDIKLYASLGVDVVKIAVSDLFQQQNFFAEMRQLTSTNIKIVAIFFANKELDLSLIPILKKSGFYGAMLDTDVKKNSLLDVQSKTQLKNFIALSHQHQLVSGLAGSVNKSQLNTLLNLQPTFVGLRGGVCEGENRVSALSCSKVMQIKAMLLNYNIIYRN
ncbi:MAG: (5-formylfuran-3-yl)methyl phosphate synthase [Methylophilaceae bacterium]